MRRSFPTSVWEWQRLPGVFYWESAATDLKSLRLTLNAGSVTVCVIPSQQPFYSIGFAGPVDAAPFSVQSPPDRLELAHPSMSWKQRLSLLGRFFGRRGAEFPGHTVVLLSHWPNSCEVSTALGDVWLFGELQNRPPQPSRLAENRTQWTGAPGRVLGVMDPTDRLPGARLDLLSNPTPRIHPASVDVGAGVGGSVFASNVFSRELHLSASNVTAHWDMAPEVDTENPRVSLSAHASLSHPPTLTAHPDALGSWLTSSRGVIAQAVNLQYRWMHGVGAAIFDAPRHDETN